VSTDESASPAAGDSEPETLEEAFADFLGLVEETIRTQVTDEDVKARIRHAMNLAAARRNPALDGDSGWLDAPGHSARDAGSGSVPAMAGPPGVRQAGMFSGTGDHRPQLDELAAVLGSPGDGPAVLAGPGGSGKTTIAADLAARAREQGSQVWWVSAADPVALSQGLMVVARQLGDAGVANAIGRGDADAADRLWRLLGDAGRRWLLVLDEADDPGVLAAPGSAAGVQDLRGWARSSDRGLAVVTSRETDPRMWGAARLLPVAGLEATDAARMLLELAPSAGDEHQARALARRLDGHPLTLRLAGSYLHSQAARGATFAAYERALGGHDPQAGTHARRRSTAATRRKLTARALRLSLDGLSRQGIPQVRPVLQLASCYAPATIPASLLNADSLAGVLADPGDAPPAARDRAGQALRELEGIGILEPAQGGVVLHTAITEAARASLDGPGPLPARIRHAAIRLVHDCTTRMPYEQAGTWPQYLLLGSHLLSLLDATATQVNQHHLALLMQATAVTAGAFNVSGASQAGLVLCERALARSGLLGSEHRAVLRVRHSMAWAVMFRGDLDAAEALYRDNYEVRLRVFGPEDPDVLLSRHELAWIAACRLDWRAAEAGYRATLGDSNRILGPDHLRTMLTRHELAWAIANQGRERLDEAIGIFREVLADRHRVLGPEHMRTLTTVHELAWCTAREGAWEKAEADYGELLVQRERVLGADHPDTLVTRHELGWVAARRGRTAEAESRYRDVLDHRRRVLGEDHPDTRKTLEALEALRRGQVIDATHLA
jgi:tetratricopeptide (TPR) repeat protein